MSHVCRKPSVKKKPQMHFCGEQLVLGVFERHIGTLVPKKVPKEKLARYREKR